MPLNDDDFMRYSRHILMDDIGESGQEKLINSRILIVGLGGLGCPVSTYLAGAGVGFLTLCDPFLTGTSAVIFFFIKLSFFDKNFIF